MNIKRVFFCILLIFSFTLAHAEKIGALLHPQAECPLGTKVVVSFGMPFPKGFITSSDLNDIVIKDSSGEKIATYIEAILPWRNITIGKDDDSIRSALVQFEYIFESTDSPVGITIEIETARWNTNTAAAFQKLPVRESWVLVNDDLYPSEYGVYEPVVYVTLPPVWLGKCQIKSKVLPFGTVSDFDWYDKSLTNEDLTHKDGQNFFKTMINNDSRVTEENDIEYLTGSEPWLFDRAMTMYNIYIRSGKLDVLREAHRATFFYASKLSSEGFFTLKSSKDKKYSYGESLLTDIILTGDTDHLSKFSDLLVAAEMPGFTPEYVANKDHGLWTERHLAYVWLIFITGYEATGSEYFAEQARSVADIIFHHQDNPPSTEEGGQAPNDGVLLHQYYHHEGGIAKEGIPYWIFSPWMSTLLVDAMQRYHLHSGDTRVVGSVQKYADAIINFGLEEYLMDGEIRTVPHYLCSSLGFKTDSGKWADVEHALDVAKITAFAYYLSGLQSTSPKEEYLEITNKLINTAEWAVGRWIRETGPEYGKSIYRLSPPRKFNWWFRTTSDLDYLVNKSHWEEDSGNLETPAELFLEDKIISDLKKNTSKYMAKNGLGITVRDGYRWIYPLHFSVQPDIEMATVRVAMYLKPNRATGRPGAKYYFFLNLYLENNIIGVNNVNWKLTTASEKEVSDPLLD